jgi:hypothetical protein
MLGHSICLYFVRTGSKGYRKAITFLNMCIILEASYLNSDRRQIILTKGFRDYPGPNFRNSTLKYATAVFIQTDACSFRCHSVVKISN